METAGGSGSARWSTALALALAVLLLSVFDAVSLVALPLAVLMIALPAERRWRWVGIGVMLWAVGVVLPGGALAPMSRGWALLLGGAFLLVSLLRPQWRVLPRALTALALAGSASLVGLALSGSWAAVDGTVQKYLQTVSSLAVASMDAWSENPAWVADLGASAERWARLQWTLFPAVLGLQSLAALALASWWLARIRGEAASAFRLGPLREFRFSDQLVWVVIAGLVLVALPPGAGASRIGYNALFFMGGLYALRGMAVFLFFAGGASPVVSILFGVLIAVFLYPLVLTAALLVGLGDTWLDIRGRATLAPRP